VDEQQDVLVDTVLSCEVNMSLILRLLQQQLQPPFDGHFQGEPGLAGASLVPPLVPEVNP